MDLHWEDKRVVFSGDLGRYDDPVMVDPEPIREADYVVVESTYGDRVHDRVDATEALGAVIERTVARGGTVVISKRIGQVTLNFADGQERAQARGQGSRKDARRSSRLSKPSARKSKSLPKVTKRRRQAAFTALK